MIVRGVLVDERHAAWLVMLLADGRRRAKADGAQLPEDLRTLLAELDAAAARAKNDRPAPADARTMSVREAAELLQVSERRVTQLLNERKLLGQKKRGVWAVDVADVLMRLPSEPIGTPSEAA